MKNLWKNLDKIAPLLEKDRTKIILLDFDGTLTPIVKSPEMASLSPETKRLLRNLNQKPNCYLAVVSGRKLKDLKEKIKLPNVIYGGNHGLEGEIFNRKFSFPITKKAAVTLKKIREQLNQVAGKFKGVSIENKSLSLSFHYRLAGKQQVPAIKLQFKKILKPYTKNQLVSTAAGKMVFDICPRINWNKGSFAKLVIQEIQSLTKATPIAIFIGDDTTDEDVFQLLKKDITINVGENRRSSAEYILKNTREVFKFLKWIESLI